MTITVAADPRLNLGGQPGATLKEYICKLTVRQLARDARKPGSRYQWVKDDKRQQLLQATRGKAPSAAERPADKAFMVGPVD
jgi:NADH:ubiquinone reductase (H+-translocating)